RTDALSSRHETISHALMQRCRWCRGGGTDRVQKSIDLNPLQFEIVLDVHDISVLLGGLAPVGVKRNKWSEGCQTRAERGIVGLLCSRNARPREGPRWTRAVGHQRDPSLPGALATRVTSDLV